MEDYLLSEWARIEAVRPKQTQFAQAASTTLGFEITVGNLKSCVDAVEKRWPANGHSTAGMQAAKLKYTVAISEIAQALIQLSTALNEPVRPSLRQLMIDDREVFHK